MKHFICLLMALLMVIPAALAEENNRYDAMEYGGEPGWVCVQRDGLWGVVDSTGTLVIPCEWDEIGLISEMKVAVSRDGLWGYLDLQGNVLLPVEWDALDREIQGYFNVSKNNLWGLVDADGTMVVPLESGFIGEQLDADGNAYIFREDASGKRTFYLIENGEAREVDFPEQAVTSALPQGYEETYLASAAGWWVKRATEPAHYRFADLDGHFLTEHIWDEVSGFTCGLSMVKKDGKVGFVNEQGEIAIPLVYDGAWDFSDDMTLVRQGDERFWIDTQGNRLFGWDWAGGSRMVNGVAMVRSAEGLYGVIDKEGNLIGCCEWDDIEYPYRPFISGEIMRVKKGGLSGFISKQGALLSERFYDLSMVTAVWYGDTLFLLENGVLSIWAADGTKVY